MSVFLSRRTFGYASAALAAKTAATILGNRMFANSVVAQGLLETLQLGEATAFAQGAAAGAGQKNIIVVFHGGPKMSIDSLCFKANSTAVGMTTGTAVGALYQPDTSVVPSLGLASWNAVHFANNINNVSMAVVDGTKCLNGTPGNHTVTCFSTPTDFGSTGSLGYAANAAVGALVSPMFATTDTVDLTQANFGPNGASVVSYTKLADAAGVIGAAVTPLAPATNPQLTALLAKLDGVYASNSQYRQNMAALGEKLSAVGPAIAAAGSAMVTKTTQPVTDSSDIGNPAALKLYNPYLAQWAFFKPLIDAGLITCCVMCAGWPDSNGGGSFTNTNGGNVNGAALSDSTGWACLFQGMAQVMTDFPTNAYCINATDGARGSNTQPVTSATPGTTGGDNSTVHFVMVGPQGKFPTKRYSAFADAASNDGNTGMMMPLSNGTTAVPATVNMHSTVMEMALGQPLGTMPTVKLT